jgi:hypothetical protein
MDQRFAAIVNSLHSKFEMLIGQAPSGHKRLPKGMPKRGIYLFSEGDDHLYIGRTNRLRERYGDHTRPSSSSDSAPFAFKLARLATGKLKASYGGDQSRKGLLTDPVFFEAFRKAKDQVRAMDYRFVEEVDPTTQALLEAYCCIVLRTKFNDFDTH